MKQTKKLSKNETNQIRSQYVQISIKDHESKINNIKGEIQKLQVSIGKHETHISHKQRELTRLKFNK